MFISLSVYFILVLFYSFAIFSIIIYNIHLIFALIYYLQNIDPEGLCVVTLDEFSMSTTLRIVKYNVGAFENSMKLSGSTYTQKSLPVDESIDRAVEELLDQFTYENINPSKVLFY